MHIVYDRAEVSHADLDLVLSKYRTGISGVSTTEPNDKTGNPTTSLRFNYAIQHLNLDNLPNIRKTDLDKLILVASAENWSAPQDMEVRDQCATSEQKQRCD